MQQLKNESWKILKQLQTGSSLFQISGYCDKLEPLGIICNVLDASGLEQKAFLEIK